MVKRPIWIWFILPLAFMTMVGCGTLNMPADDESMLTDDAIREFVFERLDADPMTASSRLGVDVRDGVVTLYGKVDSQTVRLRALGAVRATPGVNQVVDKIRTW